MMILPMIVVLAVAGNSQQKQAPVIDGEQLDGFRVAAQYLEKTGANVKPPFKLGHYAVFFLGNFVYYFDPKIAPGEKPQLWYKSQYGYPVKVTVDPKKMEVVSAVIE